MHIERNQSTCKLEIRPGLEFATETLQVRFVFDADMQVSIGYNLVTTNHTFRIIA